MQRIIEKKNRLQTELKNIDKVTLSSFDKDFELTFTHNSTAIEGNTLTLMETKVILEDGITVGGKELREIYEELKEKEEINPLELAAWTHAEFVRIHPFAVYCKIRGSTIRRVFETNLIGKKSRLSAKSVVLIFLRSSGFHKPALNMPYL